MPNLPVDHIHNLLKLSLSALLGGVIGLERERWHKPAGFRTGMLVCLGSTLFTVISLDAFRGYHLDTNYDPTRMIAQIIVGIGFLGAGVIFRKKDHVEGITTAASLWVKAAIGVAVGTNFYLEAMFTTFFVLLILIALGRVEILFTKEKSKLND